MGLKIFNYKDDSWYEIDYKFHPTTTQTTTYQINSSNFASCGTCQYHGMVPFFCNNCMHNGYKEYKVK